MKVNFKIDKENKQQWNFEYDVTIDDLPETFTELAQSFSSSMWFAMAGLFGYELVSKVTGQSTLTQPITG